MVGYSRVSSARDVGENGRVVRIAAIGESGARFALCGEGMAQKSVHVMACAEGWAVEEDGSRVSVRQTQAQAEQIARAFASGSRAEVIVHRDDRCVERSRDDGDGVSSRRRAGR